MTCFVSSLVKTCLFFAIIAFIDSQPALPAANTDADVLPRVEEEAPPHTKLRHQAFEAVMKLAPHERYIELGGGYICDDRVRAFSAAEKAHTTEGFWNTLDEERNCRFLEVPMSVLMTEYTVVAEYECRAVTVFDVSLELDNFRFPAGNGMIERIYRGDVFIVLLAPAESCLAG